MSEFNYDLLIIGAGPGGYEAAFYAAELGMKVAKMSTETQLTELKSALNVKDCMPTAQGSASARTRCSIH